ncbi:MAG: DUF1315 family protein [Halieaceae bacterium]|nr:DUF1315 family protein [Halieaceae bacterium]
MKYQDLVEQITPELYTSFKRALELGRWPDGREMSPEQRSHCLDAVIAYDQLHHAEQDRVGYIDRGRKSKAAPAGEGEQLLRFADQQAGAGEDEEGSAE